MMRVPFLLRKRSLRSAGSDCRVLDPTLGFLDSAIRGNLPQSTDLSSRLLQFYAFKAFIVDTMTKRTTYTRDDNAFETHAKRR